jgi:uncharacterized protein (UPF0333 family)
MNFEKANQVKIEFDITTLGILLIICALHEYFSVYLR